MAMNDQISKLWVIKFCLKVVYPKFNFYTFLVYLAVKYRIQWQKDQSKSSNDMTGYTLKTISAANQQILVEEYLDENISILLHKCITVSREEFIQLSSENLFYIDNGVLWVGLKLSKDTIKTHKTIESTKNRDSILKKHYNFLSSELHEKLFNISANKLKNIKIVPIVGSKLVKENDAYTTECEYSNIENAFDLNNIEDVKITFHPVPSIECAPKIAEIAEASVIVNDYDLSNDFLKEVLSNHFEKPKLVSLNDIFSIDLTPNITAKYHYKYFDLVENTAKLYFKCTKVNDHTKSSSDNTEESIIKSYFIVKGVTQLNLGESIHSIKPKDVYFNERISDNNLHTSISCPTGLKKKFNEIQDTIAPFVTGDINELSSSLSSPIVPLLLLTGSMGSGRHTLVKILAKYNGMNYMQIDCNALQSSTAKQTETKINSTIQKAKAASPVIVLLDNFEVFAIDPENNEDCRLIQYFMNIITELYQNYSKHPIIFIAVTERQELKPNILRLFLEKFHIPRLTSQQRYEMLEWFTTVMQLQLDGEQNEKNHNLFLNDSKENDAYISKNSKDLLQRVAAKTETFLYGDIDTLMHFAIRESYLKQQHSYQHLRPDPELRLVGEDDFKSALESIRSLQSQHLDAPKIPKVYWEDIGGLEKLKKELLKAIEFPIKYPHLFKNSSLKRSGILLYGPPGCGKTLVAKAVSTELNVSFLSVKGPELLNMYIGQSEENVRKVFESARASSPCVVFLDELDALAPRRGAAGDSGGASDRVVSQLLAEIDGVTAQEDADTTSFVFIMAATNRPDLLEQSLLRPGRLDKLVYVGPYCGDYEKTSVLKALARNYKLKEEVQLETVSAALPQRCTGADLRAVVDAARASAVRTLVHNLHTGLIKESELNQDSIILGASDLLHGIETFHPSVTDDELAYYESLQTQM